MQPEKLRNKRAAWHACHANSACRPFLIYYCSCFNTTLLSYIFIRTPATMISNYPVDPVELDRKRWVHTGTHVPEEFDRAKTLFSGKLIQASSNNNLLRDILVRFQWVLHIYTVGCQNRCTRTRKCSFHWMILGRMLALPSSDFWHQSCMFECFCNTLQSVKIIRMAMGSCKSMTLWSPTLWQSQQSLFMLAPSCQHGPQQHDGLREVRLP